MFMKTKAADFMDKRTLLYSSLLLSLLAEGAELTRAELEKKLAELAASPTPTSYTTVTCYVMAVPPPTRQVHICPVCGTRTLYRVSAGFFSPFKFQKELRASLPELRELGLDIDLEDTEFCLKCSASMPFHQKQLRTTGSQGLLFWYHDNKAKKSILLPPGISLELRSDTDFDSWLILPEFRVASELVDEGKLLKNSNVRLGPGTEHPTLGVWPAGTKVEILPVREGDDPAWRRVRIPSIESSGELPAELNPPPFPRLYWKIMGTRTVAAEPFDNRLLLAFLKGEKFFQSAGETPVKSLLPRLTELLGNTPQ